MPWHKNFKYPNFDLAVSIRAANYATAISLGIKTLSTPNFNLAVSIRAANYATAICLGIKTQTSGDTVQRCHFYMDGIFKLITIYQIMVQILIKFNIYNISLCYHDHKSKALQQD